MRLSRSILTIVMIIWLFLISIAAYGQSYQSFRWELDQITKNTKFKFGPFRIFPSISFRNIGYDDNVYYQRPEDNPASDFTGTVSPEARIYLLFRDYLILSFTENPEYVYYHKQKRERSFNNTMFPAFKFLFLNRFVVSGTTITVTEGGGLRVNSMSGQMRRLKGIAPVFFMKQLGGHL